MNTFQIFKVPTSIKGQLFMMPAPGRHNQLKQDLATIKSFGISQLICLLETREMIDLQIDHLSHSCDISGIQFKHLPIGDFDVPSNPGKFLDLVETSHQFLGENKHLGIHCFGGRGRSSLLAISILKKSGLTLDRAREVVEYARGTSVPETEAQWSFLKALF